MSHGVTHSLIVGTAARLLTAALLAASLFFLLRGHNDPGGGFIGGLVAAIGLTVHTIAEGPKEVRDALRCHPLSIALAGLGASITAGLWGLVAGYPFLTGMWPLLGQDASGAKVGLPIGSVLMFDTGVYLVVVGAVMAIVLALEEDAAQNAAEIAIDNAALDKADEKAAEKAEDAAEIVSARHGDGEG